MMHKKIACRWFVLAGFFIFLLMPCGPAEAEELIVYTGYYNRDNAAFSNLYSIKPDGSGRTQLTNYYPYSAKQPTLSNDGKQLAFSSNLYSFKSLNYEDIFRFEIPGAKLIRVTGGEYNSVKLTGSVKITVSDDVSQFADISNLTFSFQGCTAPVSYDEYSRTGALLNVPATYVWVKVVKNKWIGGSGFVQVPAGGSELADLGKLSDGNFLDTQPCFSPDGTRITGISSLAYYNTAAFYPDGSIREGKSQYGGFDKLAVYGANGSLIDDFKNGGGTDSSPRYSPDGTKIAYCRGPIPTESIIVVPSTGLNGQSVTVVQGGTDFNTLQSYGFSGPAWSPDGSRIACTYMVYDTSLNMTGNIILADSNGSGNLVQLTSVPRNALAGSIDYSPDGQWIVYSVVTSKNSTLNVTDMLLYNISSDLYKKNLATGEEVRLTSDGSSGEPCWGYAVGQPAVPTNTSPGTATTTIPGGTQCPFAAGFDDDGVLQAVRKVRATLAEKDPGLVYQFYEHAAEITAILAADPALQEKFRALVGSSLPLAKTYSAQGAISMQETALMQIAEFLRELKARAGRDLSAALDAVLADIEQGTLPGRLGITVIPG
jgi:Tol biopolymer transport system component